MKNFKLILKSLISNNACIEGGRKKQWFFAAIMFFLAMILAILPLFVQTMNNNGDDVFASYSYGADVATLKFNEYLNDSNIKLVVKSNSDGNYLDCEGATEVKYIHTRPVQTSEGVQEQQDYLFFYRKDFNTNTFYDDVGDQTTSFFYLTSNQFLIHIVNFDTKTAIQDISCNKAAKYLSEGKTINELLSNETDVTAKLNATFANWKLFIRDSYNFTRLTLLWQTCAIMGGINVGITLFMGLMIWILTRGKNNPYRLFNLWETQKMAWWTTITPALLTLAFGFLIPRFANVLFPMLIGVRVMWLSMKSLRPDGSGYAESN